MTLEVNIKGDLTKFKVDDNDIIMLSVDAKLTNERRETVRATLKNVFPNNKVLIIDRYADLKVLSVKQVLELLTQEKT